MKIICTSMPVQLRLSTELEEAGSDEGMKLLIPLI